ncbi:MAG: hypothetical protein FJY85_09500 [Deltaproteobacteria bacterium]|nr:hypothetical protein [Deltaproteobacteria bacterium]
MEFEKPRFFDPMGFLRLREGGFISAVSETLKKYGSVGALGNPLEALPPWAAGWVYFDNE